MLAAVGAATLALAAAAALRTTFTGADDSGASAVARAVNDVPRPQRPAFVPDSPVLLRRDETRVRYAPVVRTTKARAAPNAAAPIVAPLARETPEGTTNIVLVLGETNGAPQWVHVSLPVLPNSRTAWVLRSDLGGYGFVHTRLVVDRARFVAALARDGRVIFRAPIGVGTSAAPTPAGSFYVRDKLAGFGDPFYGPIAFGTSARSSVLTDWPGGGFVGIHGTNRPDLIPGRISHGCIRLRNRDIARLSTLMPVGTPVVIR